MFRTVRGTSCVIVVIGVALVSVVPASAQIIDVWGGYDRPLPDRSWRDLRYEGVVEQSTWYTCGPAAVATLLTYFFSIPTTEEEALHEALAAMEARGISAVQGIPLLALRDVLAARGIPSEGFRVTPEDLVDYFVRGGLPVILHVSRPQPHFVVAIGWRDGLLLVADPSFGRYWMSLGELTSMKGFEGYVLVPIPDGGVGLRAHRNQSAVLKEEGERLQGLRSALLGEGWGWR